MSPSLIKMWISFAGMAFMFIAIALIIFSRYKLQGVFKFITALAAYIFMILSGIIMFITVFA